MIIVAVEPDPILPVSDQAAERQWPLALRSLRHGDFRRYLIGLFISLIGSWMQVAAQAWLVYDLTKSPLYLGIVGACGSLPILLFSLPAGVIADRFSKRKIVFVTQSIAAVQAALLALLVYLDLVKVWHVMALAGMLGVVNALDMPTRQSMVLDLVDREDLFNAVSLNSTAFNSGRIIGPSVAGLLLATTGMTGCFVINAISFLPLIIILTTIPPRAPRPLEQASMLEHIASGVNWVRGHPVAMALLALTGVASLFAMPYAMLMPVFAGDIFHTGPQGYGILMSVPAVGSVLAVTMTAVLGHRIRLGTLTMVGAFLFPIALILLAVAPSFATALPALFLIGFGMMSFNATSNTILQKEPPDELRGRVMGLRAFLFAGMAPMGNLQIGATAQWLGPRSAVAIGAIVCAVAVLVAWWRAPGISRSK
jgi:MFS family permease